MKEHKIHQHSWSNSDRLPHNSSLWDYVNKPVDLSFADPPYNYGVHYAEDETGDCMETEQYMYWTKQVMRKLASMTKKGGLLFWLCPAEDGCWVWYELNRYGRPLYGKPIIWYERFSQYQTKRLTSDYRMLFPIVIGSSYKPTLNPDDIREESVRQQMKDKRADPRGRVPGHVWTVRRLQGNAKDRVDWHKAQLPPEPLERIVKGWSNEGETILDAFAGSGSMGVVCQRLNRWFVGVEQSTYYCRQIMNRMEEHADAID